MKLTPYNTGKVAIGSAIQPTPPRMPLIEGDDARIQSAMLKPPPKPYTVDPIDVVAVICAILLPLIIAAIYYGWWGV